MPIHCTFMLSKLSGNVPTINSPSIIAITPAPPTCTHCSKPLTFCELTPTQNLATGQRLVCPTLVHWLRGTEEASLYSKLLQSSGALQAYVVTTHLTGDSVDLPTEMYHIASQRGVKNGCLLDIYRQRK